MLLLRTRPRLLSKLKFKPKPSFLPHQRHASGPAGPVMDAIRNTIAENFGGIAQQAARAEFQFSVDEVPAQDGKVAVITGGISFFCVHCLPTNNTRLFTDIWRQAPKESATGARTRSSSTTFPRSLSFPSPKKSWTAPMKQSKRIWARPPQPRHAGYNVIFPTGPKSSKWPSRSSKTPIVWIY